MAERFDFSRIIALFAGLVAIALPLNLQAEGISLLADYEYFSTKVNSTAKDTGIVTDTEALRFSELYMIDISRLVYPNLFFNLGGYFEQIDGETTVDTPPPPALTTENKETTIRPYMEVNLQTPLYKTGLSYRKRKTETSGTLRADETLYVDDYSAIFNWRPVDLPLLNLNYQRIDFHDVPLTFDASRDTLGVVSKYTYKDYTFNYLYNSLESFDNLQDSGSISRTHNGSVRFGRSYDYGQNRFDVKASAKYVYNTIEFTGANAAGAAIDIPADSPGSAFYILLDVPPTNDNPRVTDQPLTDVNIGDGGGSNPVSIGLSFDESTEVDTVYIELSEDLDPSVAGSFTWQFYSKDDPIDSGWALKVVSSDDYNTIDNRFEIRLSAPVNAREIKVTTTPQDTLPNAINISRISAYTTVRGSAAQKPENFDQFYSFGLQWTPNSRTVTGYEGFYRTQESRPGVSERTSWTNSLFFRHIISPIFTANGRLSRNDRTRTTEEKKEDLVEHSYTLSLRADYLDPLNQTLTYSGSTTREPEGTSTLNSFLLRTNADLYRGWSMNLDLGYAFNALLDDIDQTVETLRVGTRVEPNRFISTSLDYTITWTDQTATETVQNQYGTFRISWAMTDTLSSFFSYNFRKRKVGEDEDESTYIREFSINWAPFPDGALQFSVAYSESIEFGNRETKTISPTMAWRVANGVFLDLRYNTGTTESSRESTDFDSIIGKLRLVY